MNVPQNSANGSCSCCRILLQSRVGSIALSSREVDFKTGRPLSIWSAASPHGVQEHMSFACPVGALELISGMWLTRAGFLLIELVQGKGMKVWVLLESSSTTTLEAMCLYIQIYLRPCYQGRQGRKLYEERYLQTTTILHGICGIS